MNEEMIENQVEETVEDVSQGSNEAAPSEPKKEEPQESFANLRKAKERAEREKEEYYQKTQEYERLLKQYAQTQQQQPEEDDEIRIGPDDLAEGKHLSKVGRKIKKLEEQLKQQQSQYTAADAKSRLQSQYPDFYKVVNVDTLKALKDNHPELEQTLNASTDLYTAGSSAYKVIKQFGLYQEETVESKQAEANAAKPRALASVSPQQGDSPLSRANAFANGLTDDLKKQLFKEMNESRKGY